MDTTGILLNHLKSKGIIDKINNAKKEVSSSDLKLRKSSDLFVRDAITGLGTILKEDLDEHFYITSLAVGTIGKVQTYAIIHRKGEEATVSVYAHEGLVKRHLAEKALVKIRSLIE